MVGSTNIVAISAGNTRVHVGQFVDGELRQSHRLAAADVSGIVKHVIDSWNLIVDQPAAAIVLASVNDPVARTLASAIEDALDVEVYRVGEDLPVPIGRQLDPETITGIDRLLNAAAAYDTVRQACVVVDAGTAVTVDFVDGNGTFHGGAIAPGATMQLAALHEHTSALPEIEFQAPDAEPFGRSTAQAMLHGVYHGIRGMVWRLVEHYAEAYGAYPLVVATGGDADVLFEHDELIDRRVPELTLLGIAVASRQALESDDPGESSSPQGDRGNGTLGS